MINFVLYLRPVPKSKHPGYCIQSDYIRNLPLFSLTSLDFICFWNWYERNHNSFPAYFGMLRWNAYGTVLGTILTQLKKKAGVPILWCNSTLALFSLMSFDPIRLYKLRSSSNIVHVACVADIIKLQLVTSAKQSRDPCSGLLTD